MFVAPKFAAAVASIALLASAGSASAQDFVSNGRTSAVYHGDLDLRQAAGQQQLRSRIARAASRVCSSMDLATAQACKAKTLAQVQAPVSAAIARAETGERYADASKEMRPVVGN
ncbi:MAG: UrcA family protein [Pseudomonadota bacterium]